MNRRQFLTLGAVASGTFAVRSTPGRGTTIVATLPVDLASASRELSVHDAI